MASDDEATQQQQTEQKPDVGKMQVVVRAQVRTLAALAMICLYSPAQRNMPEYLDEAYQACLCEQKHLLCTSSKRLSLQDGSELQFRIRKNTPFQKVAVNRLLACLPLATQNCVCIPCTQFQYWQAVCSLQHHIAGRHSYLYCAGLHSVYHKKGLDCRRLQISL